ncbi:MAG TPA: SUMF1/EgtB/PvdO family nonheme iron enzyme, partial [Aggregatilineales bacterium]|nr:SUMF1/EgtB/PvdO family nonheme iron enzyme [Aggregatilineales bacterium]
CVDMCGNIWEWCINSHEDNTHIVRGGSWFEDEPMWYTTHFRQSLDSDTLWNITGFRLCCILS